MHIHKCSAIISLILYIWAQLISCLHRDCVNEIKRQLVFQIDIRMIYSIPFIVSTLKSFMCTG